MRTTFHQLIKGHPVRIPRIQRDYVQGLNAQVRSRFLSALRRAFEPGSHLDLDFIYGTVADDGAFEPLDGQQRLTTLFLLHWYLAFADGRLDEFRFSMTKGGTSRFDYETRPSSREFFRELVHHKPTFDYSSCGPLSPTLEDEPWFFRVWWRDPTVRSALEMLDAIGKTFSGSHGFYERLTGDMPPITFQTLNLKDFNLSDELYVKMNARGKPLTPFENFKAQFERHLETDAFFDGPEPACKGGTIAAFVKRKIDTAWPAVLWCEYVQQFEANVGGDGVTAQIDDAFMCLVRTIIMVTRAPNRADKPVAEIEDELGSLRTGNQSDFELLKERGYLDRDMVVALISVLESWSDDTLPKITVGTPNDRRECNGSWRRRLSVLRAATLRDDHGNRQHPTFSVLVQVAGYVQFVVAAHRDAELHRPGALDRWMRVVQNLAVNTIDGVVDFRLALGGLRDLAPGMRDIEEHLTGMTESVTGFTGAQLKEEKTKAKLLHFDNDWRERIQEAENNWYLTGQIAFLLRFADLAPIGTPDQNTADAFDHYFDCATQMFDDIAAADEQHLWKRSLLTIGDYFLPSGWNHSRLQLNRHASRSWRAYLRDDEARVLLLKKLWDALPRDRRDRSIKLAEIAVGPLCEDSESPHSTATYGPWREVLRASKDLFEYGQGLVRFSEAWVFLLAGERMSGKWTELFTHALYETAFSNAGDHVSYDPVNGETSRPGIVFKLPGDNETTIRLIPGDQAPEYVFLLEHPESPDAELSDRLIHLGFTLGDNGWRRPTKRETMEADLRHLMATPALVPDAGQADIYGAPDGGAENSAAAT